MSEKNVEYTEHIKEQLNKTFTKFILDISKLKKNILGKTIIEKDDNELMLMSSIFKNYSKKKVFYSNDIFEYELDVQKKSKTNDAEKTETECKYQTLDDISGTDISSIFASLRRDANDENPEETKSKSNQTYNSISETESNYDYGECDLTEDVDNVMYDATLQLKYSIESKQIDKIKYKNENILFVGNDDGIIYQYTKKKSMTYQI